MRPLKVFFQKAPSIFISGALIGIQKIFSGSLGQNLQDHKTHPAIPKNPINEFVEEITSDQSFDWSHLLVQFKGAVSEAYQNYPTFMLLVFLLNILIVVQALLSPIIQQYFSKKSKEEKVMSPVQKSLKDFIISAMKKAIIYTFIYLVFHLCWFAVCYIFCELFFLRPYHLPLTFNEKISPEKFSNDHHRMLEEKGFSVQSLAAEEKSDEKLSLSIGKVVNSMSIDASALILSRDLKTAFVMTKYVGVLQIIDVRNFQSPVVIRSLNVRLLQRSEGIANFLLSNDEKLLFIADFYSFEIVNISNYEQPFIIYSATHSLENLETSSPFGMALTKNENFFFLLVRKSLLIYDISVKRNIKRINFAVNGVNETLKNPSSLAIGPDDRLYLTSDGALLTYDVSDVGNIKRLGCFNSTERLAKWITLSKTDKETAYIVSQAAENTEGFLEKVDISDPESITRIESFGLEFSVLLYPRILAMSPDESQLFISTDYDQQMLHSNKLLVVNQKERRVWDNSKSLLPMAEAIAFQSTKKILAVYNNHIQMIELYSPFPNSRVFSLSNNVINSFNTELEAQMMGFSADEKFLFVQTSDLTTQVWDVSNPARTPSLFKTIDLGMPVISLRISQDSSKLYALGFEKTVIYDISNLNSTTVPVIGELALQEEKLEILDFVMTKDEKYQFLLQKRVLPQAAIISILNMTSPGLIQCRSTLVIALSPDNYIGKILLSRDQKIFYFLSNTIGIYNVSDRQSFQPVNAFSISSNEIGLRILFAAISHDDKTLFVQTQNYNRFCKLSIYNVSDLKNPVLLSESPLPFESSVYSGQSVLSSDSRMIYFVQQGSILLIDVSDVKAPKILGVVPTIGDRHVGSFLMKSDENTAYLQIKDEIFVVDIQARYTLFLKRENFLLGKRYMEDIMLLSFNKTKREYEPMAQNSYKFIKSSLLDVKINYNEHIANTVVSTLPYWLNFDKDHSLLTIEPQSENTIGTYTFCAAFSSKISGTVFVEHGLFENKTDSVNLIMLLVSLGYVDNRYFLTPSLTTVEDFMLPDEYTQDTKEDIFDILKEYYFETCTKFDLEPSLHVSVSHESKNKKILITTPNANQIKLDIKLGLDDEENVVGGQFLLQSYKNFQPKVSEKSSRLILEGSLRDIGLALQKLVVNLENDTQPCDGKITVTDYLNPQVTRNITNISEYFKLNGAPKENDTNPLQSQINAGTFATGQSFTMLLDGTTFYDPNSETLNYELFLDVDGKRAPIPNWLSFNHLFFKGTPPEEVLGRDFALILVVKNEFKEIGVPFNLHVQISPTFAMKLAAKYFPYILTIIGLVIFANKIYNIFGKRKYKHPKEFLVKVGEEITNNMVFPVMFISQEKQESEVIFRVLEKFVKKELLERDLASYFMKKEQGSIDKVKLILKVEEVVDRMGLKEKEERLQLYCSEDEVVQKIIQQLIFNRLAITCLDLPTEKSTKKVYDSLKDSWIDIVDWDEREGLIINKERFYHFIGKIASPQDSENFSLRENLLRKSISEGLLKDAILAYAYENHHIDYFAAQAHINMKYKEQDSNFIFTFLKYDLKDINYSGKQKAGFGVKYEMKNDTLYFYGVPDRKLNQNELVIQITTAKQRILKEIWIRGSGGSSKNGVVVEVRNKARRNNDKSYGKSYEVL